jgi:integrase
MHSDVLTDALIRKLKPSPNRQYEKYDKKVTGLGIRTSTGGSKSFFLAYRIGGLNRRLTFGRYPIVSLAQARTLAREALGQVARGIDPANEKKLARQGYQSRLFLAVVEDFIEAYAKRKTRTWRETERILRREFGSDWGRLPVNRITKQHVNDILDAIVREGKSSAANAAFAHIRRLFTWCVERGYLDYSPCAGMRRPCKVVSRDRVLSDTEIVRVWLAADKMGWPFGCLVQLLILTGQRRSEVAGLRWEEVDFPKGLWELPPGSLDRIHKSNRRHRVPLSEAAVNLLKSLPVAHGRLAFPAKGKDRPVSGFGNWKKKIDQLSGVSGWRLHDLRRSVSTGMAALGVAPHIIELILNHRTGILGGVAGTYNRYPYEAERRQALERWSEHLEAVIRKAQRSTETPIHAADGKGAGHGGLSPQLNHMSKYRGI